jgi:N-acetylneuraminic acid mutarotase
MGMSMRKSCALLLVLVFLPASFLIAVKPVSAAPWASKAPMHQARSGLGVAVVNGKIYAIGGTTRQGGGDIPFTGGVVGTNEEYYPASDIWAFKKPKPTPSSGFAIAVYQNKIYCIGGGVNEVYDPATDTWETKEPMPTPRSLLEANVVDGKIYLIGGDNDGPLENWNGTLIEVYDPATDSWSTKAPMPIAAAAYASAVLDNKIYIIGGFTGTKDSLNQIYDPETDTWSQGAIPPSIIGYDVAGATTGVNAPKRIYVLGANLTPVYDPEKDSWDTVGANLPTRRSGFGVAVVNDMIYAIGGYTYTITDLSFNVDYTVYATNEQYTPIGYGTVPPKINIISPENKTYTVTNVSLTSIVNKPASLMGYSLDGQANVTIAGNITLTGLSNGLHNITVYAKDEFENFGASETVYFTVAQQSEPLPITWVVTGVVIIAAAGAAPLVYFTKIKPTQNQTKTPKTT